MLSNSFLVLVVCVIGGQSSPFDFGKILSDFGRAFSPQSPTENKHRITGDPPIHVKGQWIKSAKLHNNQVYLFAKDAPSMTWYEADDYCLNHGAFLAEPVSAEESNFLRNQANRLDRTNWWIGLRQFEKCECISVGRSAAATKIEAFHDPDSLQETANHGLGKCYCPDNYQKNCNGKEWRWGFTGQKMTYSYWKAGEPNDIPEYCVSMWYKSDNQQWANWPCAQTKDGERGEYWGFKPVCQKTNDNYDDDDYDTSGRINHNKKKKKNHNIRGHAHG